MAWPLRDPYEHERTCTKTKRRRFSSRFTEGRSYVLYLLLLCASHTCPVIVPSNKDRIAINRLNSPGDGRVAETKTVPTTPHKRRCHCGGVGLECSCPGG